MWQVQVLILIRATRWNYPVHVQNLQQQHNMADFSPEHISLGMQGVMGVTGIPTLRILLK